MVLSPGLPGHFFPCILLYPWVADLPPESCTGRQNRADCCRLACGHGKSILLLACLVSDRPHPYVVFLWLIPHWTVFLSDPLLASCLVSLPCSLVSKQLSRGSVKLGSGTSPFRGLGLPDLLSWKVDVSTRFLFC